MAPVLVALDDDLNTPGALAALHGLAAQVHSTADPDRRAELAEALREAGAFMGLLQQDARAWAQSGASDADRIEVLVAARQQARAAKDWARADALRADLAALGVEVEDAGGATRWRVRA